MKGFGKRYLLALLTAILLWNVGSIALARLSGTQPARTAPDTWSVGRSGAEVTVDYDGNFLPTTDNDTTLGTSALRWATAYIMDITVGDDLTVTDDLLVSDDATINDDMVIGSTTTEILTINGLMTLAKHHTPDASVVPSTAGLLIWNITPSPYEMCMSTGATAGSWIRVSTPSLACQN